MALVIGAGLALVIGILSTAVGLDRDRAFYPTILIVIGALYSLFAVMGGSNYALVLDLLVGLVFIAAAVIGFKSSMWIVVAGLAGHGVMDLFHGAIITNPGVPAFWPSFCSAYDVVAAAYLGWLLMSGKRPQLTANPAAPA